MEGKQIEIRRDDGDDHRKELPVFVGGVAWGAPFHGHDGGEVGGVVGEDERRPLADGRRTLQRKINPAEVNRLERIPVGVLKGGGKVRPLTKLSSCVQVSRRISKLTST